MDYRIKRVLDRAADMGLCCQADTKAKDDTSRLDLAMDLSSISHTLDLDLLCKFSDRDFYRDIAGIRQHINREKYPGHLEDDYIPRCAKRLVAA